MKIKKIVLGSIIVLLSLTLAVGCSQSISGNGTEDDPFVINNFAELERIGDVEGDYSLDAHYKLGSDIDASETQTRNYNYGDGWNPIGTFHNLNTYQPFTGSFDGAGHQIEGLYIERFESNGVALFAAIESAEIRNLKLVDLEIEGDEVVAGLVAHNQGGIIENSSVEGNIIGNLYVGGLVANNNGKISDSYFNGQIEANQFAWNNGSIRVGGLVGRNMGTIDRAFAQGVINAEYDDIGGLVGWNDDQIEESFAEVNLESSGDNIGGLVGNNKANISSSYSLGEILGRENVGGLAGYNDSGRITESYSEGTIRGVEVVGGLVGRNWESILERSYFKGNLKAKGDDLGGLVGNNRGARVGHSYADAKLESSGDNVGGIVGNNRAGDIRDGIVVESYSKSEIANASNIDNVGGIVAYNSGGEVERSYWNQEILTYNTSQLGQGKNSSEMKTESTYQEWDFTEVWDINEGDSYPYFNWQ